MGGSESGRPVYLAAAQGERAGPGSPFQLTVTTDLLPHARGRALALAALVAAAAAVASTDVVHGALLRLFDATQRAIDSHTVASPLLFVGLAALSAMVAFLSSAVLVPAAVYAWGPVTTGLLLWIGWMLGGLAAYAVAALLGRPALRRLAKGPTLAAYEARLRGKATFPLVVLLQLALPSELPGYLLGLLRYPMPRYLAALAIAELPYAAGTVLLGTSLVERRIALFASVGLGAALAMMLLGYALRRRLG